MSIQRAIERLMDKLWDQAEEDREFDLHDELRTILNMYPEPPTMTLPWALNDPRYTARVTAEFPTTPTIITHPNPPLDYSTIGLQSPEREDWEPRPE